MAKSRKRKNRRRTVRQSSQKRSEAPSVAEIMDKSNRKLSTVEQFQQEYAYVISDLRTVFILAAIMFALLIVLNLVLQ